MSVVANNNNNDNEITIEELEKIFPEAVLTTIIYAYVPFNEFQWKPATTTLPTTRLGSWDTNIHWQGPLTTGSCYECMYQIAFKDNALIRYFGDYITSQDYCVCSIGYLISMLQGTKLGSSILTSTQVTNLYIQYNIPRIPLIELNPDYTYIVPTSSHIVRSLTGTLIVKCDIKLLIDELKYVQNTITSHHRYNKMFFELNPDRK